MPAKVESPNLFVVGAPKSGTTTLHFWLSEHPDVFMSSNKEPRFFCDFPPDRSYHPNKEGFTRNLVTDPGDYAALFAEADSEKWLGESSTDYLWVENAARNILNAAHDANDVRIIAVLRNPVDRAFSEHSALLRDGLETLSFQESLDAEASRLSEGWHPLFLHRTRSLYASALKRYIDLFGSSSVGVFLFDDMVARPDDFMRDVCSFLEIESLSGNQDVAFNRSGLPRSRLIQKMERNDTVLKSAFQAVTSKKFRTRLKLGIQKLNLRKVRITDEEREAALELFEEDIVRTEGIIGRDLSAWRS